MSRSVDFTVVIPARAGSTRLPGKPLADLHGSPMVLHVARRARASGARAVYVATESEAIADVVRADGFDALLTRDDHATGTDRLAQAVSLLNLPDDAVVLNVQGDEPLVPPALIADCAQHLLAHPSCAIATPATALTDIAQFIDPMVVKVVCGSDGRALYFSRAPIPWDRDRNPPPFKGAAQPATVPAGALRHMGIYAFRAGFLRIWPTLAPAVLESYESLEQLRALQAGHGIAVLVTTHPPSPSVDTAADLDRVRALMASLATP